jgi:septal ring factor EnvC (AmiA/AmiB activator)
VLAVVGCAAVLIVLFGDRLSRAIAVVALLAGAVLACLLAWRENRAAERVRMAAELGQAMRANEQLRAERKRHRAVVGTLAGRFDELTEQLQQSKARTCALQQQLSTLKGNYEALRVELELQAVLNPPAPVVELAHRETPDPWVTARELWRISDRPAISRPA